MTVLRAAIASAAARALNAPPQCVYCVTVTSCLALPHHAEAPEGVPYILLTKERYERALTTWREYKKAGREWQNRLTVNNVLRDFRQHAKRAGLVFDGEFSIHTFRESCAQSWADHLPANVVKYYLGHSSMNVTNQFYSIVDESHMALTRQKMDRLLGNGTNALDTGQTPATKNAGESETKKGVASTIPSVNPVVTSTSDATPQWAVQALNKPPW